MDSALAQLLAEELLAESLPVRWRHVQGVARAAAEIAEGLAVDRDSVIAAAWLHDIGYAPAVVDSGFHPLDGARHLRRAGWPELVCRLVAHHTGALVEAAMYGLADDLESEFPDAASLERDVLWVADATTGPDGRRATVDERISEVVARYGPDHHVAAALRSSRDELLAAVLRIERRRLAQAAR